MVKEKKVQFEDYEIDLVDYVKVLLKGKWLILGMFLGSVAVAVGVSFVLPKIYRAEAVLEIGRVGKPTQVGISTLIEEPPQLVEKLTGGAYNAPVGEALGIAGQGFPEVKAENPKGTGLISIGVEIGSPQQAKDILDEINKLILVEHEEEARVEKELLGENIERLGTKIESLENEKKNLGAKVAALQETLLYQQTPGTQFALFDTKEKLEKKKRGIEQTYLEISSLQNSLEDIKLTEVVKSPVVPTSPVRPKPLLNGVIAAVLGLFLGTLLAFAKEWWKASFK